MSKYFARFFIAKDPKHPQYIHELNGPVFGGDLNITVEGLSVSQTNKEITKTIGYKYRGQDRQGTKYNNKTITLAYQVLAKSTAHVMAIKDSLINLTNIANNNADNNSVYKAYIELFLPNSAGMYTPTLGQYSKILEIVDITNQSGNSLSNDTHNNTVDFLSLGNQLNIECKPFIEGNTIKSVPPTAAAVFNSPYGTILHKQIEAIANHLPDPAFNQDSITAFWGISDPDVAIERLDKGQSLLNGDLRVTNNNTVLGGIHSGYAADSDLAIGNQIIISALIRENNPLIRTYIKTPSGTVEKETIAAPYILNGKQYGLIWEVATVADPLTDTVGVYLEGGGSADIAMVQVTRATFTDTYPIPMAMGDLMGYKWNGDPHASVTLTKTEQNKITHRIGGGLNRPFTLSFWYNPLYESFTIENTDTPILRHDTDTAEFWEVGINTGGVLYYKNSLPNTLTDALLNDNRFYNRPIHITITRGYNVIGTVRIYRNGVEVMIGSINGNPNEIYTVGDLSFLGDAQGIIDGFKLWDNVAMSAAEVLRIYNEESPVKVGGGSVSGVPYLYTKEGFFKLGNIDGFTTKPDTSVLDTSNHAIIGGLSGHVSSVPNIKIINDNIESITPPSTVYLSTVDYHKQFNLNGTFYLNCDDPLNIATGLGIVNDSNLINNLNGLGSSTLQPGQEYFYMFSIGGSGTFGKTTPSAIRDYRKLTLANTQHAHLLTGNIKALSKNGLFNGTPGQTKEVELIIGYGLEVLRNSGDILITSDNIAEWAIIPFNNVYLSSKKFTYNDEVYIGARIKAPLTNTANISVSLDTISLFKNVAEIRLIGDTVTNNYVNITNKNTVTYHNTSGKILSSVAIGFIDGDIVLNPKQYNYLMMARYDNTAGQKFHNITKEFEYNKFKLNVEYTPLWEV